VPVVNNSICKDFAAQSHRKMLDNTVLHSVAEQLLNSTKIDLNGKISRITRTSSQRLRTAAFEMNGRQYQAIEQNATKPSRWAQLAREGHHVVQFKDVRTNRFVAVSVDGEITEYRRA
jgi:hypothetical protein